MVYSYEFSDIEPIHGVDIEGALTESFIELGYTPLYSRYKARRILSAVATVLSKLSDFDKALQRAYPDIEFVGRRAIAYRNNATGKIDYIEVSYQVVKFRRRFTAIIRKGKGLIWH